MIAISYPHSIARAATYISA